MVFPDDWNWKLGITSDNTKVLVDDTDFPYYFDLSNITASDFWSNVQSDGGDLRVTSDIDGTTQVPLEVVSIDTSAETGRIFFKETADSSSDKTYYLWWGTTGTTTQPSVTDTYGRDAVWSAYNTVYHLSEGSGTTITDSAGNNNATLSNSAAWSTTSKFEHSLTTGGELLSDANNTITGRTARTINFWFRSTTNTGEIIDITEDTPANNRWLYRFERAGVFRVNFQNARKDWQGIYDGSFNKFTLIHNGSLIVDGTLLYINDGAQVFSSSFNRNDVLQTGAGKIQVNLPNATDYIEEIRIKTGNNSENRHKTELYMEDDNAAFWSVGEPLSIGSVKNSLFAFGGL